MADLGITTIELNAILIPDKKIGGFTAYFSDFPQAIAEGNTQEEAIQNLKEVFFFMLKDLAERSKNDNVIPKDDCDNGHINRTVNIYA